MKIFTDYKSKTGILYNTIQNITELNERMDKHHTFMLAAGIAFNLIIYMIPLFLLIIYLVQVFFDISSLSDIIEKLLTDYLPPTQDNVSLVHTIIDEVGLIVEHAAFFGWIGGLGLLWISSFLVSSLRISLNKIFDIKANHFFIVYWLQDILLTVIISILILVYSYALPIVNFIVDLVNSFSPAFLEGILSNLLITIAGIVTSFLLFLFIFRFMPNKRLPRFVLFLSTGISVIAIELARYIFAWYISSISNYGKFYGTYAVIISMAVWLYYSSLIILLSAEISKFIYDKMNKT
jgi:membrane protein